MILTCHMSITTCQDKICENKCDLFNKCLDKKKSYGLKLECILDGSVRLQTIRRISSGLSSMRSINYHHSPFHQTLSSVTVCAVTVMSMNWLWAGLLSFRTICLLVKWRPTFVALRETFEFSRQSANTIICVNKTQHWNLHWICASFAQPSMILTKLSYNNRGINFVSNYIQ